MAFFPLKNPNFLELRLQLYLKEVTIISFCKEDMTSNIEESSEHFYFC